MSWPFDCLSTTDHSVFSATCGSSRLAAFHELTEASRVQGCEYPPPARTKVSGGSCISPEVLYVLGS